MTRRVYNLETFKNLFFPFCGCFSFCSFYFFLLQLIVFCDLLLCFTFAVVFCDFVILTGTLGPPQYPVVPTPMIQLSINKKVIQNVNKKYFENFKVFKLLKVKRVFAETFSLNNLSTHRSRIAQTSSCKHSGGITGTSWLQSQLQTHT